MHDMLFSFYVTANIAYNFVKIFTVHICNLIICCPHLQVNTNGVLTFDQPFHETMPRPFPDNSLQKISPYWENFDTSRSGRIYYRNTTDITLLRRAQFSLRDIFPSARDFFPSYLFIATWDDAQELGLTGDTSLVSCTVVSRKYAPPFATLALVQSAGGAYTRDATFSLAITPPPPSIEKCRAVLWMLTSFLHCIPPRRPDCVGVSTREGERGLSAKREARGVAERRTRGGEMLPTLTAGW